MVFVVLFEVAPQPSQWDAYLTHAKSLRPSLEKVPGFLTNIRYGSLTRAGTILSLSTWRNEKALVKWRTQEGHHVVQEKGRGGVLDDYHLRVGEVVDDSQGHEGEGGGNGERFDETEVGSGKAIVLIDGAVDIDWLKQRKEDPKGVANEFGWDNGNVDGLVEWDVFEAVLTPGNVIFMTTWRDTDMAQSFMKCLTANSEKRIRSVRVVRDYGKYDRREAPQYYPDAEGRETLHD
jgi:heme-degrading monooxygenase HmoA